jgi:metallo-beta-lactamase family protein
MIKKVVKKVASRWDSVNSHTVGGKGNIKVICHGGAEQVTGSNFLVEYTDRNTNKITRILIDCGLPQGLDAEHNHWADFTYNPSEVDFLIITHAHMDHVGRIPFLKAKGFDGRILSTKATKEISHLALKDALHIMTKDFEKGSLDELPYKERDIESSFASWKTTEYRQVFRINNFISITLFNSSHVLGSAFVQITFGEAGSQEKILFTGDMGKNSLLLPEADIPTDSDVVFMETVYGSRLHEGTNERKQKLLDAVKSAIEKKGTLVIAAFAIERTQEVLKELNDFIEEKKIPKIPVYLDSPLAINVTKIFKHYENMFNEEMQGHRRHGDSLFHFPSLHETESQSESQAINKVPGPKIIVAGSGMIAGGRIIHHVRQYLSDPKSTIMGLMVDFCQKVKNILFSMASRLMYEQMSNNCLVTLHTETKKGCSSS